MVVGFDGVVVVVDGVVAKVVLAQEDFPPKPGQWWLLEML